MTDQPNPMVDKVTGYRHLNDREIEQLNRAKGLGNQIGEYIDELADDPNIDGRWLSIARTDLQKGIMSLVRSIAKPESF